MYIGLLKITLGIYIELKLFISLRLCLAYNDHKQYDRLWCNIDQPPDHHCTDWICISHIQDTCTIYIFSQVHYLCMIINIISSSLFLFHHPASWFSYSSQSLEGSPFLPKTSEQDPQMHKQYFLFIILELCSPYCFTDQSIYYCEVYFNAPP